MLRFAPSSTEDLHIGNLRVALFNYILSVQRKEGLLIRIEDIDTAKNIEGKDQEIIGLLDLFGIKYQEVVYQSSFLKYHRAMALQLLHEKIAFNCFCTPAVLEDKAQQAKAENKTYLYDDACLRLTPEETIDNESSFTVRLRTPNVNIEFKDALQGAISFAPTEIDSFIVLQADKSPTYNFACAIDDMIADVSMVIRHDEHISDTPKQISVRAALDYTKEIQYAHIPCIINESGKAISSKDAFCSVKGLLEEGFIPEAIINYLISIGNTTPQETFTLEQSLKWFELSSLSKTPVTFDIKVLRFVNAQHLELLDDVELSRYVGFADADIGKLAKLYLHEVSTTKELKLKIGGIFGDKNIPSDFKKETDIMKIVIKEAPFFEAYDKFKSYIIKETGFKEEVFLQTLLLLLTGTQEGPSVEAMYPYLKNYMPEIVK